MSYEKKPAWWFFWLVVAPHILQCILWAAMFFSGESVNNAVITAISMYLMSSVWMHVIIPQALIWETVSLGGRDERVRRSYKSGIKVCAITFFIMEIALLVFGLFLHMKLKFVFPVLHACSLYYLILGFLSVLRYEKIQYDVAYYAARALLDRFNYESRIGFIAGRDGRSGLAYPFLDILIWIAGVLVYWCIHSLLT